MPEVGERGARFTASEAAFVLLVVLLVWVGEESAGRGSLVPWYGGSLFGVPLHYVFFGVVVLLVLPYVSAVPKYSLIRDLRQSGLWLWLVLAWVSVIMALVWAIIRGAPELFADWRNLAVTAVVTVMVSKWLAAQEWRRFALVDLAITMGFLCVPILVAYALGSGSRVGGVRTTVFDGTTLYIASFVAIVGAWNLLADNAWLGRVRLILLWVAAPAAGLVVLLSLRRSFWVVLGIGTLIVMVAYLMSRQVRGIRLYAVGLLGLAIVFGVFVTFGTDTVIDRLESFNPASEGAFSATNEDHINDLIDAWDVISNNPIFGFGIGVRYETNLIQAWKEDSFDVHNAVLHVWLKFGLIGALAYVGFHVALIRNSLRRPFTPAVPIGAFVVGVMIATMVGTWPYGRFQMSVFMGILLSLFLVGSERSADVVVESPSLAKTSSPG